MVQTIYNFPLNFFLQNNTRNNTDACRGRIYEAVSKAQYLEKDKYPVAGNPHHKRITDMLETQDFGRRQAGHYGRVTEGR